MAMPSVQIYWRWFCDIIYVVVVCLMCVPCGHSLKNSRKSPSAWQRQLRSHWRRPIWCKFRPCAFFGGDRCCSRSFLWAIVCQTVRRFFVQNVEPWKTIRPGSLVSLVTLRNAVARSVLQWFDRTGCLHSRLPRERCEACLSASQTVTNLWHCHRIPKGRKTHFLPFPATSVVFYKELLYHWIFERTAPPPSSSSSHVLNHHHLFYHLLEDHPTSITGKQSIFIFERHKTVISMEISQNGDPQVTIGPSKKVETSSLNMQWSSHSVSLLNTYIPCIIIYVYNLT